MLATAPTKSRRRARGTHLARVELIPLNQLVPDPALARTKTDHAKILELAASLEKRGQRKPITVRRLDGQDKFFIIDGKRRWEAARHTERIRVLEWRIVDDPGEDGVLMDRITDGLTHETILPIEQCNNIKKLMERRDWTPEELADELGVSIKRVRHALVLLRLHHRVREMVRDGELGTSHALEIAKALDEKQLEIAEAVVREGLSVEETKDEVRLYRRKAGGRHRRWERFPWPGGREVWVKVGPREGLEAIPGLLIATLAWIQEAYGLKIET